MASAKTLTTVISLAGKVDGSLNRALKSANSSTTKNAKAMSKAMSSNMKSATSAMSKSIRGFAGTALKVFATIKSLSALKNFANECVTAAKAQLEAETKLQAVLENVESIQIRGPNAAVEAANKLKQTASEIQNVGVIGDEVLIAGMQQLATFQLSDKEISVLSSGMADLLAQQKGLDASQTDAVSIANMIGKVMSGSTSALSKVGITFTEAQEQAIKNGDAMQRANAISEVLQMNVGGVNKALAETDQGKIQQATNVLGDMKEVIGMYLLPLLANLASKAMPYIQKGFDALTKIMDKLAPIISNVIGNAFERFNMLLPSITSVINQMIPAVTQVFDVLSGFGKQVLPMVIDAFNEIIPVISSTIQAMIPLVQEVGSAIVPLIQKVLPIITKIVKGILPILQKIITKLTPIFIQVANAIIPIVDTIVSALIPALDTLIDPIESLLKTLLPPLIQVLNAMAPVFASIVGAVAPIVSVLVNSFLPALNLIIEPIVNLVQKLLPPLSSIIGTISSLIQSLAPAISIVADLFATSLAVAIGYVTPVLQAVFGTFDGLLSILQNIIDFIVNVFTGNWTGAWENMVSIVGNVFGGLVDIVKTPFRAIANIWNSTLGKINFEIPDWVPGIGGNGFGFPTIPEFAEGGTLRKATMLIAGEAGPETIVPHNNKPRSVALLKEAARGVGVNVGGNGGGNSIVYSPVIYANDVTGVKEALHDEYERFKAFMSQYVEEEEREVFA